MASPTHRRGTARLQVYLKHVEPTVRDVCSQCHLDRGHGRFKVLTGSPRTPLTLEQHYENFQGMLRLIRPGAPLRSRLLQKPLARSDGGIPHKGGELIRPGDGGLRALRRADRGRAGAGHRDGRARRSDAQYRGARDRSRGHGYRGCLPGTHGGWHLGGRHRSSAGDRTSDRAGSRGRRRNVHHRGVRKARPPSHPHGLRCEPAAALASR